MSVMPKECTPTGLECMLLAIAVHSLAPTYVHKVGGSAVPACLAAQEGGLGHPQAPWH